MSSVVILWIVLGLVLVATIVTSVVLFRGSRTTGGAGGQTGLSPTCSESASNLKDVSHNACCSINGYNSNLKYDPETNLVLAPFQSPYISVCSGFCDGSVNTQGICSSTSPQSVQSFNECVSILKPQQCRGQSVPIAIDGSTLYYGYLATNSTCSQCCTCSDDEICQTMSCS